MADVCAVVRTAADSFLMPAVVEAVLARPDHHAVLEQLAMLPVIMAAVEDEHVSGELQASLQQLV